jgi:protein TonB
LAISIAIHLAVLMGVAAYMVFPPERDVTVPVFEIVDFNERPKLRPLKPKAPPPPPDAPKPPDVEAPEAPKLTSNPEPKPKPPPEPKVVKQERDTTKPVENLDPVVEEMTTTIVSNVPSDPRLSFWARRVKKKVETLWNPPSGVDVKGTAKAIIAFTVQRDGTVKDPELVEGTGNGMLDDLALRTIQRVENTPPIPDNYPDDELRVSYEFIYQGH